MNAPAFLPKDQRDRAARDAVRAFYLARVELTAVLAWVEHWQRDVEAGLKPSMTSLKRVEENIRNTLRDIEP